MGPPNCITRASKSWGQGGAWAPGPPPPPLDPLVETQGRHHQESKTGVSVAPQKGLILQYFHKKCGHLVGILGKSNEYLPSRRWLPLNEMTVKQRFYCNRWFVKHNALTTLMSLWLLLGRSGVVLTLPVIAVYFSPSRVWSRRVPV